jgi:DNA-binding NarL/FixJ family response regulator
MFALGFSREKIAEALDISFSTVKRLLENIKLLKLLLQIEMKLL